MRDPNGVTNEDEQSGSSTPLPPTNKRRLYVAIATVALIFIVASILVAIFLMKNPDYDRLQGVWEYTDVNNRRKGALIVEGDSIMILEDSRRFKFTLDSGKSPKQFTVVEFEKGKDLHGIFELSEPTMKFAVSRDGKTLPTEFTQENTWLFEYQGKSANFAPVDPQYRNGLATWNYLVQVHQISERTRAALPRFDDSAGFDQLIQTVQSGLSSITKMRQDINQLPVLRVDPELTSYVGRVTHSLNQMEDLLKDLNRLAQDMQNFVDKSNSGEVARGRFWDWLLGTQSTDEALQNERAQLQSRLEILQNRLTPAQEEFNRLMAQQLELRSSLAKKYNREFPNF